MPIAALYDWLLLGHILAAMVWVGGTLVLSAFATRTLRGETGEIARFLGSLRIIGPIVLAPAPILLIGLGIWLVADSASWDFDQTWVQVAFGLFVLAFLYGAAFQSRAAISAERAAKAGDADTARRQLVRWTWGTRVILVLLVVATWDMVLKPGL
jgi:uncharacterized membrane protein